MSVPDLLPPSPPSTSHRDRMPLSSHSNHVTSTPDDSPASFLPSSGTGTRKRVGFTHDERDTVSIEVSSEGGRLKRLPRSKDCHSTARPILKSYSSTEGIPHVSEKGSELSLSLTMELLLRQLADNEKSSSIDAYTALAHLIKTYDGVPDEQETRSNIVTLLKLLRRDLKTQDQNLPTPVDMNLTVQALKVSVILVWSEHLSTLLTDDFRIFIVDRAIQAIVEHTAPKVVIVHYMHLLATQNFKSALFTYGNRISKLLEALREITNHVQGRGAISERLMIYQRLIDQVKPIMKSRASLWVKEVLTGLTSKVKDIQEKAISVCTKACSMFPASAQLSHAVRETLVEETKERTLNTVLTQRLLSMVAAKDEAMQVPNIWAVVMLMCNSPELRLESWSQTKDWLKVLQRCFNCGNINVRVQAFHAWNRFIYMTKPHECSDNMLSMLVKPIVSQLERTGANAHGRGTRPAAVSSYCILLYYAFRPAANAKQYSRAWNEYVVKIATSQFLSKSSANADLCCRIFMSLFWKDSHASRVWNENRAHENRPAEPEELPTIDAKWLRSKTSQIIDVMRLLFKFSTWGPSIQHSDQAFVAKAWRHLMKAIREAASKEIKQSADAAQALSAIATFLTEAPPAVDPECFPGEFLSDTSASRLRLACEIAVNELGLKQLVDAIASVKSPRSPAVVGLLVHRALYSLTDPTKPDSQQQQQDESALPHTVHQSMNIWAIELEYGYRNARDHPNTFQSILEIGSQMMLSISSDITVPCLQLASHALSEIIEDRGGVCESVRSNELLHATWYKFTAAIVQQIKTVPVGQYSKLDSLLSALLLSLNAFTSNQLLKVWDDALWYDEHGVYGERLLEAIATVQDRADVNLPGIEKRLQALDNQIRLPLTYNHVSHDIVDTADQDLSMESRSLAELLVDAVQQSRGEVVEQSSQNVTKGSSPTRGGFDEPQQAMTESDNPRHNESAFDYVSVPSSPPKHITSGNEQESPKSLQRIEQTITFADIPTSPRIRSHSSRATSADCELARKVAARDNAPSTPTLPRQNDRLEDEVLTSPTPKARRSVQIMEADVPSSPPSVIGNHDGAAQAMFSSPSKLITPMDDSLFDFQPESEVRRTLEQEVLPSISEQTANLDIVTGPSSELGQYPSFLGDHIDQEDDEMSHHSFADGDELDAASASQLSQDLDSHLKETSRNSAALEDTEVFKRPALKKRKRITNGYADKDRKRRRKRASDQSTANESSQSSEIGDSEEIGSNSAITADEEMGDCIEVLVQRSEDVHEEEPLHATPKSQQQQDQSPLLTGSRKRRARSKKFKRSPASATPVQIPENASESQYPTTSQIGDSNTTADFHTPSSPATPTRTIATNTRKQHVEPVLSIQVVADSILPNHNTSPPISSTMNIQTALQAALEILKHDTAASLDLRAIDDLCFQIRFQAQENVQKRGGQ